MNLTGKTGIITGGSSGIGFATANVLAEAGALVYAVSRSGKPKIQGKKGHPGVIHLAADVCDYEALSELVNRIGMEHGIDFLINNAGITVKCRAEKFLDSDFERIHQVNVNSVFKLSCLCFPYLTQSIHKGRIINITSMAAHLGFSEVVPYCSSKGAVLSMTRGLAVEWAGDRINVNSIAPGWFPSEMSRNVMDEERKQKILSRMPVHQFGDPRDIGEMAKFLVSDSSEYITGQDFAVDGGALSFGY
ncbi:SDR family NAD(P)-dependent oxidoreductase [Lacrimispora sp.]|uniref:SDR family NAD(P)-dependent oxidoreductase n=1 Tax=Lacrimispora sp. TaxID=2719234 RepID=UPI00289D8EC8|nr:SDR family oxidoreductase [Lacrimispora sp.]